ncbi:hypothetical protein AOQ84DRAFT_407400, partial [Glonium stellatum]
MSLIHRLISRGIYLVNVKVYNILGQEMRSRETFVYATSKLTMLFAFLVGTAMLFTLFGLMLRKLPGDIPILNTYSIAISEVCHPMDSDDGAVTKLLWYGVVPIDRNQELQKRHACFSNKDVEPLQ